MLEPARPQVDQYGRSETEVATVGPSADGVAVGTVVGSGLLAQFPGRLDDVPVHQGLAARDLTRRHGARAVTDGHDIAFDRSRHHPASLTGQLILAHELAHIVQPDGAGTSGPEVERDADRAAVRAVLRSGHPSLRGLPTERILPLLGSGVTRPRGLGLHACTDAPTREWEGDGVAEAEAEVEAIRRLLTEREGLVGQDDPDLAATLRLHHIDQLLVEHVAGLRALGISVPTEDLFARIVNETSIEELTEIGIDTITGAEPTALPWGERRRFEVVTGYLPPNVDVRYRWETTARGLPYRLRGADTASPTAELKPEQWWEWSSQEASGYPPVTGLRVGAKMEVGTSVVERAWTPDLQIEHRLPDALSISVSPLAPAGPGGDGPSATPRVLAGARVRAEPSWAPPMILGSSDRSHGIYWEINKGTESIHSGWGIFGVGQFNDPGRYSILATVHPWQQQWLPPVGTPLMTARLEVDALSTRSLAQQSIGLVAGEMGDLGYGQYLDELGKSVIEADLVRQAQSTEQDEVDERYEALQAMQEEVTRHMETTSEASYQTEHHPIPGSLGTRTTTVEVTRTRQRSTRPLPYPDSDDQFDRDAYYSRILPAVFVHPTIGVPQPLTLLTQLHHDGIRWQAKLVDATTKDVVRHEGSGPHPHAAIAAAIGDWKGDNEYPQGGHVTYRFTPFSWDLSGTFSTDSWEKEILEWFDTVLFVVGSIVGIILLLTPEPTGATKAAGYALLVASTLRATYGIYQSLDLGRPVLHERHILEAAGIVASLVGLGGAARASTAAQSVARGQRLAGSALTQFRIGQGMIYTSALIDTGTFVYATSRALADIRRALDDDDGDDQDAALLRVIGQLALQGVLIIGSNRDLFRTGPRWGQGVLEGIGGDVRLQPEQRSRIEQELRQLGDGESYHDLPDPDLIARYQYVQNATVWSGSSRTIEDLLDPTGTTFSTQHPVLREAYATYVEGKTRRSETPAEPLEWVKHQSQGRPSDYLDQVLPGRWRSARKVQYPGSRPAMIDRPSNSPVEGSAHPTGGRWRHRKVRVDELRREVDNAGDLWWTFPDLVDGEVLILPSGTRVWRDPRTRAVVEEHPTGPSVSSARHRTAGEATIPSRTEMGSHHEAARTERAHGAASPGLGFDSPYSVARAPRRVNQQLENRGIETYVRSLRDNAPPGVTYVFTTRTSTRGQNLSSRVYEISAMVDGELRPMFRFEISVDGPVDTLQVRFHDDEVVAYSDAAVYGFPPIAGSDHNVDLPPTLQRALGTGRQPGPRARPRTDLSELQRRSRAIRESLEGLQSTRITGDAAGLTWSGAQDRLTTVLGQAEDAALGGTLNSEQVTALRAQLGGMRIGPNVSVATMNRYADAVEAALAR